ncbi:hypothetical protein F220043C3_42500 [Enterocloster asparagiformis]
MRPTMKRWPPACTPPRYSGPTDGSILKLNMVGNAAEQLASGTEPDGQLLCFVECNGQPV